MSEGGLAREEEGAGPQHDAPRSLDLHTHSLFGVGETFRVVSRISRKALVVDEETKHATDSGGADAVSEISLELDLPAHRDREGLFQLAFILCKKTKKQKEVSTCERCPR